MSMYFAQSVLRISLWYFAEYLFGTLFMTLILMAGRRLLNLQDFAYGRFLCLSMELLGLFLLQN